MHRGQWSNDRKLAFDGGERLDESLHVLVVSRPDLQDRWFGFIELFRLPSESFGIDRVRDDVNLFLRNLDVTEQFRFRSLRDNSDRSEIPARQCEPKQLQKSPSQTTCAVQHFAVVDCQNRILSWKSQSHIMDIADDVKNVCRLLPGPPDVSQARLYTLAEFW